jgi:fructose-bisphosphate aldolase, class I
VASTLGVLGAVARKYAHKIPFIVKLNHNELLTYPNKYDQILFGSVEQAFDMGAVAVGATIYFGSESRAGRSWRSPRPSPRARAGHGDRAVVLPAQQRFKKDGVDYHVAADLTGQANHLGVTIQADIIKQKLPENNGGYNALKFGKTTSSSTTS